MASTTQTTATLQTPPGVGGIAVIALAGPEADRIAGEIFHPHAVDASPRQQITSGGDADILQLGFLRDGREKLDEVILCQTEGGVEINIHGGSAVARRVMRRLAELGASATTQQHPTAFDPVHPRWNNPAVGEEMLVALPAAVGLLATSAVTQQWSAGLSRLARETIVAIANDATSATAEDFVEKNVKKLRKAAAGLTTMQKLLNPVEVVLAGPPNSGKSTLANLLVGRAVSIVHDSAGTTRDWLRELAIVNGVAVWLTDTAGLWETARAVDAEAVRRAWLRIEQADLVLLTSHDETIDLPEHIHAGGLLRVATKTDLTTVKKINADVCVSANTGEGMENLKKAIVEKLSLANIDPASPLAFTQRQADLLTAAAEAYFVKPFDPDEIITNLRSLLEKPR